MANLNTTIGDLGVQSDRIATNGKELSALRQLGERNYYRVQAGQDQDPRKGRRRADQAHRRPIPRRISTPSR